MTRRLMAAAFGVLVAHPSVVSAQCAMCRSTLAGLDARMADAFRSGVLFLFAAPFAVFGLVALLAVRDVRRRAREDQTLQVPPES